MGAVLLIAGFALLGLLGALRLRRRAGDLRGVLWGLEAMERSLSDRMEPLEGMLACAEECTAGRVRDFFARCRRGLLSRDERFVALWRGNLEKAGLFLDGEDRELLQQLGEVLGRYDAGSQSASLRQTARRLELRLRAAEEESRRLGKVYGTSGIAVGLMMTVLLL